VVEEEFRISLYRHWSLLEAMAHSDYVATKMKVWTCKGKETLKTMIAKMGIPLKVILNPYLA
jgi:cell division control protein 45